MEQGKHENERTAAETMQINLRNKIWNKRGQIFKKVNRVKSPLNKQMKQIYDIEVRKIITLMGWSGTWAFWRLVTFYFLLKVVVT